MDTGVSTEYIEALRDEVSAHRSEVVSGRCKSFDSYRFKTGYIQGIEAAERILHEVIEHMMATQDLDLGFDTGDNEGLTGADELDN